jgi:hypothetical protein
MQILQIFTYEGCHCLCVDVLDSLFIFSSWTIFNFETLFSSPLSHGLRTNMFSAWESRHIRRNRRPFLHRALSRSYWKIMTCFHIIGYTLQYKLLSYAVTITIVLLNVPKVTWSRGRGTGHILFCQIESWSHLWGPKPCSKIKKSGNNTFHILHHVEQHFTLSNTVYTLYDMKAIWRLLGSLFIL